MIDIRQLFGATFTMVKQRAWPLVAIWAVFLALQLGALFVLAGALGVSMGAGLTAVDWTGDPAALLSVGIGVIVGAGIVYLVYFALVFAQQAGMTALASPLESGSFSDAVGAGFKAAPSLILITVILTLLATLGTVLGGLAAATLALALGEAAQVLFGLLALPFVVYIGCRFAVLVPIVAVERVFNPITAIWRSWRITEGKVVGILLAILGFALLALAALGLPFALAFGSALWSGGNEFGGGVAAISLLLLFPAFLFVMIASAAFTASLHAVVSDGEGQRLAAIFG